MILMERNIFVTPALQLLKDRYTEAGFELWFVGGCVRDSIMGIAPKDIDLTTSATPEEQVALYDRYDYHYIATGLQHGTLTVVIDDEPYEITTYRIDRETDGRHAVVEYTRDLRADLERRDLTINAIAMDFDGTIFDPFGGVEDIANRTVRFVGNANDRITEDYLRILRYFRFYGRFGNPVYPTGFWGTVQRFFGRGNGLPNRQANRAIRKGISGLRQISVERVWMEVSKIISGPNASVVASYMRNMKVFETIGMPDGVDAALSFARKCGVTNPASIMGYYVISPRAIDDIADAWKWATEDRQRANFIAKNYIKACASPMPFFKEMLVSGTPFDWVADMMRLSGYDPVVLADWPIPVMPVTGKDLIERGVTPGPEMGQMLKSMKAAWIKSDYTVDKDTLLSMM